jgi:excisionase family DNA binding protein
MTTHAGQRSGHAAGPCPERLYTYAEIAELAAATERQVRRWVDEGKLDYVQLPRGRRVTRDQFLAFINDRTVAC